MRAIQPLQRFLLLAMVIGLCAGAPSTRAQQAADRTADLHLVPVPKDVAWHEGTFAVSPQVTVVLGKAGDTDDAFAASALIDEIKASMDVRVGMKNVMRDPSVVIARIGRDPIAARRLPALRPGLLDSIAARTAEGYVLDITPRSILIAARTGAGVYYGVQTLCQLIRTHGAEKRIPCLTIVDWPTLRYRGVMLDISRGPIPTMGYLKEVVATLAEYKQNAVTLYTENVFRLRSHPDVAPADGITPAQVAELAAFARAHHCELIGNAQPFGHMEHTLAIPFYRPLAENPWVISPAVEASYDYLKELFAEVVPSYSSSLFHINSDEVSGLGEGPARRMVDSLGTGGVYAYHINRVNEIVKPYGKRLMMWGDIAVNNPRISPASSGSPAMAAIWSCQRSANREASWSRSAGSDMRRKYSGSSF